MNDCIFRVNNKLCSALKEKQCEHCSFYKSKKEYKTKYYLDGAGKKQKGVIRL